MSNWSKQQEAQYKEAKEKAFKDLMTALEPHLKNPDDYTPFIKIWVDGSFSAFWEGWHSHINADKKEPSRTAQESIDAGRELSRLLGY